VTSGPPSSLRRQAVRLRQVTALALPAVETLSYPWLAIGALRVDFTFVLDQLSAVMLLVITGVGFLIHVYSVGYMRDEPGYARYFSFLNLFLFFMTVLVLAGNFLLMFVGWEGVGLASYLLIGFYLIANPPPTQARRPSSSTASATSASSSESFCACDLRHAQLRRYRSEIRQQFGSRSIRHGTGPSSPLSASAFLSALPAKARSSRSTSGCPTPWKAPRPSPRSSTPPPWSPPAFT
jgi:hypothetical protein